MFHAISAINFTTTKDNAARMKSQIVCQSFPVTQHKILVQYVYNWRALWKNRIYWYISFSAHHSMVFCFQCSVYWWKGSVRF